MKLTAFGAGRPKGNTEIFLKAALMAADIPYTMRVETNLHTPEACADQIVAALFGKERRHD